MCLVQINFVDVRDEAFHRDFGVIEVKYPIRHSKAESGLYLAASCHRRIGRYDRKPSTRALFSFTILFGSLAYDGVVIGAFSAI